MKNWDYIREGMYIQDISFCVPVKVYNLAEGNESVLGVKMVDLTGVDSGQQYIELVSLNPNCFEIANRLEKA